VTAFVYYLKPLHQHGVRKNILLAHLVRMNWFSAINSPRIVNLSSLLHNWRSGWSRKYS